MKPIWRKLVNLALVLVLAVGTAVVLSGCERESPVEEVGEAVEEAGEAVGGDR